MFYAFDFVLKEKCKRNRIEKMTKLQKMMEKNIRIVF